jgi:hypothetical protein
MEINDADPSLKFKQLIRVNTSIPHLKKNSFLHKRSQERNNSKIVDSEFTASKEMIGKSFLGEVEESETCYINDIKVPFDLFGKLTEYETSMENVFLVESPTKIKLSPVETYKKSEYLDQVHQKLIEQTRVSHLALSQQLEWDRHDIKYLKSQLRSRKRKLGLKELSISQYLSNLKQLRISLAYDQERIEKEKEELELKHKSFNKMLNFLNNTVEDISENIESMNIDTLELESPCKTQKTEPSIFDLQQELNLLENKNKSSDNSEFLEIQISSLKSKIQSLKSIEIINNSLKRSRIVKKLIENFGEAYPVNNFHYKNKLSSVRVISTSADLKFKNFSIENPADQSARSLFSEELTETKEDEASKLKLLNFKEIRLLEKEDELNKREERIINFLEKVAKNPEQFDFIKMEKMNLNKNKKIIEAKQKAVEKLLEEVEKTLEDLKNKKNEVLIKNDINEKNKKKLEKDREYLISNIYKIRNCIEKTIEMM